MTPEVSEISKWIPVIGTILGAIVGFLASFFIVFYNQRRVALVAKEDRMRQRLEDLYRTLIFVNNDYTEHIGQMINKVHHNVPITVQKPVDIPPLIKVEMLVNLYFPEFKAIYGEFENEKDEFGKLYADTIGSNYQSSSLENKQKICGAFVSRYKTLSNKIERLKESICKQMKT